MHNWRLDQWDSHTLPRTHSPVPKRGLLRRFARYARARALRQMERLLSKGVDPDAPVQEIFGEGVRPLDYAIRGRHIEVVEWLLDHGVQRGSDELLNRGAQAAWVALLECALRRGADVVAVDRSHDKGLIYEAIGGRWFAPAAQVTDAVRWLYAHGCDPRPRSSRHSPLHRAACFALPEVVDLLLGAGADPNALDEDERTPLYTVCDWAHNPDGHTTPADRCAVIRSLVRAGANVNRHCGIKHMRETALHRAASNGAVPELITLCKLGANVEALGDFATPLMEAASSGNVRAVRALLHYGARADRIVDHENVAWDAVKDYDMLRLVIRHGANPRRRNARRETLLHRAAQYGADRGTIKYLLSLGLRPNARDVMGKTPADTAWECDKCRTANILDLLVLSKTKRRARRATTCLDELNRRPGSEKRGLLKRLAYYAYAGAVRQMERINSKGVDLDGPVKAVNYIVMRPLDYAISSRQIQAVEWLLSHGVERSPNELLIRGAEAAWVPLLQCAVSRGADISAADATGAGLIHTALLARPRFSGADVTAAVKWLYAHGCNPLGPSDDWCPLHLAARWALVEVVELLLRAGADPNRADESFLTPLGILCAYAGTNDATSAERCAVIRSLVRAGADVNQRFGKLRQTALHLAAYNGAVSEVITLCKLGASLEGSSANRMTPLMTAAWRGHIRVVRALLHYGARANRVAGDENVCWSAVRHHDILRLVIRHGADPYHRNREGETLLHAAVRYRASRKTIRYLVSLGLDPGARDLKGQTPAQLVPEWIYPEVRDILGPR